MSSATQHHIIKEVGDTIGQLLQRVYKENGYKRVHVVVAAPKNDAVEGKLPAVCVYLYNIAIDPEGLANNVGGTYIERVRGADGKIREVRRDPPKWVRLDYLISTWAQTPEEEQLLMGGAIKGFIENPTLRGNLLKGDSFEEVPELPMMLTHKLDEGVLSRFWGSLNQPMKPALQVWTTIPIIPSGGTEFKRVTHREVRYFDVNKLAPLKR